MDFRRLVDSIEAHTSLSWELVVSDASDIPIETQEVATEETWPKIHIIPERPRVSCTYGYNRAFEAASGQFVLWANDDAILEPNCADIAVQFMRDNPHVGLGAIPYAEPGRAQYRVNAYFGMIYANFGILRRSFGNEIGWFDEDFPMYGNDNSLAFRVLLTGKGIAAVPGARMFHYATLDEQRRANNSMEQRERDVSRLVEKYFPHMEQMRRTYRDMGGPMPCHDQTPRWAMK